MVITRLLGNLLGIPLLSDQITNGTENLPGPIVKNNPSSIRLIGRKEWTTIDSRERETEARRPHKLNHGRYRDKRFPFVIPGYRGVYRVRFRHLPLVASLLQSSRS